MTTPPFLPTTTAGLVGIIAEYGINNKSRHRSSKRTRQRVVDKMKRYVPASDISGAARMIHTVLDKLTLSGAF
jgi:hypothetical protein